MKPYDLDSLSDFLQQAHRRYQFPSQPPQPGQDPFRAPSQAPAQTRPELPLASPPLKPYSRWDEASQLFARGESIQAIVTGWNRGGLLVRWHELQGFVPISQLREIPFFDDDQDQRDEKLAHWVGEELTLRVIELDAVRNRLVFSERATIWAPKEGDRVLDDIIEGQIRRGQVSNLCDFGAFVDLGGVDGLIHISELSWGRVNHPREILELGQYVDVYVINVDKEQRRVGLSLKQLQENPWTVVEQKYQVGQVIPARVTNIVAFGAFAQIGEGLEGLIHISEMSEEQIAHPSEIVQIDQQVQVRILRIDCDSHRLGLSMLGADGDLSSAKETAWEPGQTFLY